MGFLTILSQFLGDPRKSMQIHCTKRCLAVNMATAPVPIVYSWILTSRASPYFARSIPPVFSRMGVRVALLTAIPTKCDFERGGATKP